MAISRLCWILTASSFLATTASAQDAKPTKTTYEFKRVGDCKIQADVYRLADEQVRPVVLWYHGGALIMGGRQWVERPLKDQLVKAGYIVVSADYRLAPETKLSEILTDVQDAYRWVREKGPALFHADPDKIAVAGASAGGYLTLTAGYTFEPRPRALVSLWGYGEIAGKWYSRTDPFYSKQRPVSKDEAYRNVSGAVVSENGSKDRSRFYLYCRQQGLWPKEVTGHDPDQEPKAFDAWCPVRHISAKYPPTLLVHGTKDTDVPYEQSEMMAKALERQGIEHELITIPDAGHGLAGVKPAVVNKTYSRVMEFLNQHLR